MGVFDMAKMVRKAQQTKSKMSKITAVGKSKSGHTTLMLNGLNDIEDIEFSEELIAKCPGKDELKNEVVQAFKAAKKNLETQLSQNIDLDSLRDMLS